MFDRKVTIAFPVYNVEKYVSEALTSVLMQNYGNLEILIIDDYGTDESITIINKLITNNKNHEVKIITHSSNLGIGAARNSALDNASGQFIFFVDSDDQLMPNAISNLMLYMNKFEVDFIGASHITKNQNGVKQELYRYERLEVVRNMNVLEYIKDKSILETAYIWNKLYKVSFLKSNNIRCTYEYIEDEIFSFKVYSLANSCALVPDITYEYNVRNNSITQNLMSNNNVLLKTARIYTDIASEKYNLINMMDDGVAKARYINITVGGAIYKLKLIFESKDISYKDKMKFSYKILEMPAWKISLYHKLSFTENIKYIYYSFLSLLPLKVKFFTVRYINFIIYQFFK